jgi:hypothetical protein
LQAWEKYLVNDHDKTWILDGVANGFKITNRPVTPTTAHVNNYQSALNNRTAVEKQIREEITEGRYIITDKPATIVSALGAIDKPDGGVRLIHDASRPAGLALNDYAINSSVTYQSVKDAISLVEKDYFMAKVDLKSAYRSVGLHPSQYQYTGLQWHFKNEKTATNIVDTRLCFGARLAPSIFNRLTQAICRIMAQLGYEKTVCYLDDFLVIAKTKDSCMRGLNTLISLLRELGFAISWPKVECPSQSIVFLGVLINSVSMSLHLPEEKVASFKSLLSSFASRKRATCRQLQTLAGKLSWASHVVVGGRIFLQRVLDTIRPLRRSSHKAILSHEFHKDIRWWLEYLDYFNCSYFHTPVRPRIDVCTDASDTGGGIVTSSDWYYMNWDIDLPHFKNMHINSLESASVLAALFRWAPQWEGCDVVIHTDNTTTICAFNKGKCRDSFSMECVRTAFWITECFNIRLQLEHIPGRNNIHADAISRLTNYGHYLYWISVLAVGNSYTPLEVKNWLKGHCTTRTANALLSRFSNSGWSHGDT